MHSKNITALIIVMLVAGAFLYAASGKMFVRYSWDMIVEQEEFAKFSMEGRT
jgi:hypothetical protein